MRRAALHAASSALLASLAACGPAADGPATPPGQTPAVAAPGRPRASAPPRATAPEAPVTSLAGEWRVAGIDGASFDEPYGLGLSADEGELWWNPKCAAMWRTYRISGGRIVFALPRQLQRPDGKPPPVCTIGLPPRLPEVFRALDAAETIARTPSNGILIAGGGHSVTLFAQ